MNDFGYAYEEALSGREALKLAEEHDFAAILLDVQMPGMDGFETAKRLRATPRSRVTPIIFVTAIHRSEEYEQRGYIAGAVDYLFKPINTQILESKLAVFAQLFQQAEEIRRQGELLREQAVREKENQMLKQALAAKDEFISMASHELRTPMTPLLLQLQSLTRMLQSQSLGELDPVRVKHMLSISGAQVQRLARTVDELLDVSRISTNKLNLNIEEVDLGALVERVIALYAAELQRVNCVVDFVAEPGVIGYWDPFRLEQVLINFLSNAARYAAGKPLEVRVWRDHGKAAVSVRDEGIGIKTEDQSRIFQRFERAASSRHFAGLGLGLYISQQIVTLHRGEISVESEPAKGSRFTVKLPIEKPAAVAPPELQA